MLRLSCLSINIKGKWMFQNNKKWYLKLTGNVNTKDPGRIRNENVFPHTILDKGLQANSGI